MEKNTKIKKNKKIIVFSHDAGGAQILSSYLFSKNIKVYGICKGPALKIFQEKNIKVKNLNIKKAIEIGRLFFYKY